MSINLCLVWEYKRNILLTTGGYNCKQYVVTYGNKLYVTFVIKDFAMKDRLIQLLDLEQLSPSKFADIIGVQRSSISHVISGRNKPSFDFLQKTLKAFPGLNASWLMLGDGTMYEQMGRNVSGNLFDSPVESEELSEENTPATEESHTEIRSPETAISGETEAEDTLEAPAPTDETDTRMPEEALKELASSTRKRIVQVMVIYEDDTFRAFTPAH